MTSTTLIRLGGLAAVIAGILRGLNSLLPSDGSRPVIATLYLVTDFFILLGLFGIYGCQHQESKLWGFCGFLLAIIGILTIRTGTISSTNLYPSGAMLFAAGLCALAISTWIVQKLPRWVSVA
jgi:hypothetical protein